MYKLKPKTIKEMAMGSYLSVITLNINELNAPTKDKDWLNGYKNKTTICCLQETHLKTRDTYRLKVKGWKKIIHTNTHKKESRSSNTHMR